VKHSSQIRLARAGDASQIGEIARAAYAKYVPKIGREPAPMAEDFAAAIARGSAVVIEAEGVVRGFLIGWPEPDGYFIESVAVDPLAQGHGLGRKLLDHAARQARALGLRAMRLYTNVAMTENLALYRHIGFVETHRAMENGFDRVYMRWDFS
jgi:ribosomal protein S18 acetylase RimI-like enzyme